MEEELINAFTFALGFFPEFFYFFGGAVIFDTEEILTVIRGYIWTI